MKVVSVGVILAAAMGFSAAAQAEKVTPAHVYQSVETLNGQLVKLLDADFEAPVETDFHAGLTQRRPRHVLQKAREALDKVQMLRRINGLPTRDVEPMPVRQITPGDVIGVTRQLVSELADLRPLYGLEDAAAEAEMPAKKTPTDVYGNLRRSSALLDQLGIPQTVPNDVYRVALTIIGDIEKIRRARGLGDVVVAKRSSKGKTPMDAYDQGFLLLETLRDLSERHEISKEK